MPKSAAIKSSFDPENTDLFLPQHIAIIMDGNGRWARKRNLPRIEGHRQGAETVRRITRRCRQIGIPVLTLYAFSDENWQRPKKEIAQLMELLAKFLVQERKEMLDNQIALRVIGDIGKLPQFVQNLLKETLEVTAKDHEMVLNLALSYGARNEILRGMKRAMKDIENHDLDLKNLTPETFSRYLDTADLPDPDLLIRTSGEMRISNFLLWQLAYAEMVVTPVLWPDFDQSHLQQAIAEFQKRERRFGLTSEQLKKAPQG